MLGKMSGLLSSIFGVIGSGVKGFFGLKKEQGKAVQAGLQVLSDMNASSAQREQAIATIIAAEANSGYWLAACWRPLTSVTLAISIIILILIMIICAIWTLGPDGLQDILMPVLKELIELFKICLMGYIPGRSIEKIASSILTSGILKKFIEKKVL